MSTRDEFGYKNGVDDILETSGTNRRNNYAVYKDPSALEYYIVSIAPIDEKIKNFKRESLFSKRASLKPRQANLYAFFSPYKRTVQEVIDACDTVTDQNLGVIDNKVHVMGPGASYLFPVWMNSEDKRRSLNNYVNDSTSNHFAFKYQDNNGKNKYFLRYDDEKGTFVEVDENLYIMHLIQSGNFSALNDIGDYETINRILDCFEIKESGGAERTDGEREISKAKRFSDVLARRFQ